jgi:RNA polymerase sigma-70 factor (ECF subfamily)
MNTPLPASPTSPASSYEGVAQEYGAPLQRLVVGYEADPERQNDLLQEIHVALWRALPSFEGRSSLRTWVYRVAHNVAVGYVVRSARDTLVRCVPLEVLADAAGRDDPARTAEVGDTIDRLAALVRRLRPADRQLILLYLEGFDHSEIAEVCGISPENAATKVHRIKRALAATLESGGRDASR